MFLSVCQGCVVTELQQLYLWLDTLNKYPTNDDTIKAQVQNRIHDIQRGFK